MLSAETYLQDPCGTLSLPWWKNRAVRVPDGMRIVHHRDLLPCHLEGCTDEPYFRLYHDLACIPAVTVAGFSFAAAAGDDLETMVSVINRCYSDLTVSLPQLEGYRQSPVFAPDLWVMVRETATGRCVACGIADYDRELGELILEWVQVLPEYRRKGLGQAMVCGLLHRGKVLGARFATVSGQKNNPTNPEGLYRRCGFTGGDVWHILCKRKNGAQVNILR